MIDPFIEARKIIAQKQWERGETAEYVYYKIKDYIVKIFVKKWERLIICDCYNAIASKENSNICKHKIAAILLETMKRNA